MTNETETAALKELKELKTLFEKCQAKYSEDAENADSEQAKSYHEGQESAFYAAERHVHATIEKLERGN